MHAAVSSSDDDLQSHRCQLPAHPASPPPLLHSFKHSPPILPSPHSLVTHRVTGRSE
jgi:hypothetical protein